MKDSKTTMAGTLSESGTEFTNVRVIGIRAT